MQIPSSSNFSYNIFSLFHFINTRLLLCYIAYEYIKHISSLFSNVYHNFELVYKHNKSFLTGHVKCFSVLGHDGEWSSPSLYGSFTFLELYFLFLVDKNFLILEMWFYVVIEMLTMRIFLSLGPIISATKEKNRDFTDYMI